MARRIRVGDVFTITPGSINRGWTELPRTVIGIRESDGMLTYTLPNGACHTITPQRLKEQIENHTWVPYVPVHLTLPIGA